VKNQPNKNKGLLNSQAFDGLIAIQPLLYPDWLAATPSPAQAGILRMAVFDSDRAARGTFACGAGFADQVFNGETLTSEKCVCLFNNFLFFFGFLFSNGVRDARLQVGEFSDREFRKIHGELAPAVRGVIQESTGLFENCSIVDYSADEFQIRTVIVLVFYFL
jgi:hypothetical protein